MATSPASRPTAKPRKKAPREPVFDRPGASLGFTSGQVRELIAGIKSGFAHLCLVRFQQVSGLPMERIVAVMQTPPRPRSRGEGARLSGGRWNSRGTAMVYTAGSEALAILEMLVHLDAHEMLNHFVWMKVAMDESLVRDVARAELPADRRSDPPPIGLRAIGDAWVREGASAVLRVPGVLVESGSNYLLNPAHPDFRALAIGSPKPFAFDPRMLKSR